MKNANNPGYVSFFETMDPGQAQRLTGIPTAEAHEVDPTSSPWRGIWAEAKVIYVVGPQSNSNANDGLSPIRGATVVAVDEDVVAPNRQGHLKQDDVEMNNQVPTMTPVKPENYQPNPIEFLIGILMTLAAMLSAFSIEIASAIVYSLAHGFFYLGEYIDYGIFIILAQLISMIAEILFFTERIILYSSLMVSEILAYMTIISVILFCGPTGARLWHNHVRKMAHLVRCYMRHEVFCVGECQTTGSNTEMPQRQGFY